MSYLSIVSIGIGVGALIIVVSVMNGFLRETRAIVRGTTADIAVVQQGLRLLEQGLPLPDLLTLAREHNEATHDIAETAVALFDRYVRVPLRESDLPDEEKAEQLVEAFRTLLPAVTTLVAHHFRRVLLEVAQEHLESVGEATELAAVNAEAARRLETVWPS